jgi:hypothetical protein
LCNKTNFNIWCIGRCLTWPKHFTSKWYRWEYV